MEETKDENVQTINKFELNNVYGGESALFSLPSKLTQILVNDISS